MRIFHKNLKKLRNFFQVKFFCGHKTEKVVLPGQCVGSKKNRVFLGFLEVTLRFEENLQVDPLCIQPAVTNPHSTTSSGTRSLQR